jgi:hypothetical protein
MKYFRFAIIEMFLICCIGIFTGCSIRLPYTNDAKPNSYYYTNLLAKDLSLEKNYKVLVIDMNFYNEKAIDNGNIDTINGFIHSLKDKNFINKPKDLPSKPLFKMIFTFSKDKFVINVYNENYLSIFPWTGNYDMDYISMTDIPISYNLFNLSKYIIPNEKKSN